MHIPLAVYSSAPTNASPADLPGFDPLQLPSDVFYAIYDKRDMQNAKQHVTVVGLNQTCLLSKDRKVGWCGLFARCVDVSGLRGLGEYKCVKLWGKSGEACQGAGLPSYCVNQGKDGKVLGVGRCSWQTWWNVFGQYHCL